MQVTDGRKIIFITVYTQKKQVLVLLMLTHDHPEMLTSYGCMWQEMIYIRTKKVLILLMLTHDHPEILTNYGGM